MIPDNTPVWWPSLFDALLSAALTRKVYVRLLVSKSARASGLIEPFPVGSRKQREAQPSGQLYESGQFEIKQFIVPGWDGLRPEAESTPATRGSTIRNTSLRTAASTSGPPT